MGADLERKFREAVQCLHSSPSKKLVTVGPGRFLRRQCARFFRAGTQCKADLFFGKTMTVVLPEVISQQIYTYGLFDEIVTGMVLRAVRQGDVVVDIGAHFGYFTLLFAHLVGEAGRVVSLEPTPSTFSVLQKNTAMLKTVTPLNMAAGCTSGRLEMSDFGLTYSAWNTLSALSRMPEVLAKPKARVEVAVIRLDDWCERESIQPTVIKIDAENFEEEVVSGLVRTIEGSRPLVLMETGSEGAIRASRVLFDLDYRLMVSDQPGVLKLQKDCIDEALIQNKDVLFVPATETSQFM
jgi:FkbM family methyltransferase